MQLDWILGTPDTLATVQHSKVYRSSEMIRFAPRSRDNCMLRARINIAIAKSATAATGKRPWHLLKDPAIAREFDTLLQVNIDKHDKAALYDLYNAGAISATKMPARLRG